MKRNYHESPPRLRSLAIAVPPYTLTQREVMARAHRLFDRAAPDDLARMLPVYGNAGIETRYSCVPPEWYETSHGWAEKNRLYLDNAAALLERAASEAIAAAGLAPRDIGAIVAVSTTGIATPSLDALIIDRLNLPRTVERLPVFGLGCAGGVIGLARAAMLARLAPGRNVLFLVVELCGLTFRRADRSKSNVIATALFGDGAAAAVLSTEADGPAIAHWGEHTWPGSLDVMGWSVEDDGLGVVFSRDIPTLTRTEFRSVLHDYLATHELALSDIDEFVCHPGGAKVLDALEDAFEMEPGELELSRSVLRDYGNMSAATVLFVLRRTLDAGRGGRYLLSALGPGFTAAFLTIERASA
jgi:alkylresorcinol/alkylpyrone synthase